MAPSTVIMKAAAIAVLAAAASTEVLAAAGGSVPSECIAIDSTSTCAPFSSGHYINATYLGLVYGLDKPIPSASYWDTLIKQVTAGGTEQAAMWSNWVQCSGYKGQPIQYYRSYACITDIFYFSQGCNVGYTPPAKSVCSTTVCDSYGLAVKLFIEDPKICPTEFDANTPRSVYDEVYARRNSALEGSRTCNALAAAWEKDGYKNNAADCQYGTDDDHYSCGFAGQDAIADYYCTDYPTDPCCSRVGKRGNTATPNSKTNTTTSDLTKSNTKVAAAADVQTDLNAAAGAVTAAAEESFAQKNKIPLAIAGSLIGLGVVAGAIVGVRRVKSSRSSSSHTPRPRGKMTAGTAVPFLAPDMKETSKDRSAAVDGSSATSTKHKVVYDYTPQLIDELELAKDDVVEVWASYDDGWGKGLNTRSGNKGTFPMACLEPLQE